MNAFNNTKTNKDLNKLFHKIANKLGALKMLLKIVSNDTEKKNVIKGVEFISDYVACLGDSEPDFCSHEFSNIKGKWLKILTPNQMVSRLPISLAQLKAGNSYEKLKNEIRQILNFLYR